MIQNKKGTDCPNKKLLLLIMRNILIATGFCLALLSCSPQAKLSKKYDGQGREKLLQTMGEPQQVVKMKNGNQLFVYRKETAVRETEIGTGDFTLDPRISPGFLKIEEYRFEVDSTGIIKNSTYEKMIKK
jgi:hypothetical protein